MCILNSFPKVIKKSIKILLTPSSVTTSDFYFPRSEVLLSLFYFNLRLGKNCPLLLLNLLHPNLKMNF